MRKKLIDSSKSDLKKYMMIVESAGKVPASTKEDFTLDDIENPYFQGDEDTEESDGNRYYLTVGVKIGFDENVESYFPELIWDTETGTEIEFDKLDKISKKAIQDKCDEVGSKMSKNRDDIYESKETWVIMDKKSDKYVSRSAFSKPQSPFVSDVKSAKTFDAYFDALNVMDELKDKTPSLSLIAQKMNGQLSESTQLKKGDKVKIKSQASAVDSYGKYHTKNGQILTVGGKKVKLRMFDGTELLVNINDIDETPLKESTQVIVKALMQKFQISESRAKQIVAKVSESLAHKRK